MQFEISQSTSNISESDGTSAVLEILHRIWEEVETGNLNQKRVNLEQLLQHAPAEWFHPGTNHDLKTKRYQELRDICTQVILLLIKQTKISLASCHESDAGDYKYKEHASLAYSAMSLVKLLLSKLSPIQKGKLSEDIMRGNAVRSCDTHAEHVEVCASSASNGCQVGYQDAEQRLPRLNKVFRDSQECRSQDVSMQSSPVVSQEMESHFSIRPKGIGLFGSLPPGITEEGSERTTIEGESEEQFECSDRLLRDVMKATVGPSIVLCASHAQKHPWTNKASLQAANALLNQLTSTCGCNSLPTLLSGCHSDTKRNDGVNTKRLIPKGAFRLAMVELKQQLTRNDWKKYPAAKHTFAWLLAHLKMENKVLGIQCLRHIIDNVDPTELRWYGRAEVIYEALHPLLYNHKPDLIDILFPCLLAILKVIEKDPKKTDQPRKLGRYDKALQIILNNMEGEQRILVRQANARHLPSFIDVMGITILWHMKRLIRIIIAYLETSDGPEETGRLLTLRILQAVILQAWPRMMTHCSDLMKSLLKLLLDISRGPTDISPEVRDTVGKECIECMTLLKRCCGTVVEDTVTKLLDSNLEDKLVKDCLENVLKS
ncbi:TELO2-interacting protein 2-like isoform X2 [Lytechinus variegatus]|uniref:TELO2-interacting protein 2-like isoform X2 n=1 Tax=Lytechinus variegatus TaxID=7654 RepID=UPI001BB2BB17|nr:TELO2-interacting protein 2-like isoform X2 [Lytechinus variegatus]